MTTGDQTDSQWHLDKKVPISIIFAMLLQFAGGMWFVSKLESRVLALEDAKMQQADRDNRQDSDHNGGLTLIREDMREIGRKLDRLVERERGK